MEVFCGEGNDPLAKGSVVYSGADWLFILQKLSPSQMYANADNNLLLCLLLLLLIRTQPPEQWERRDAQLPGPHPSSRHIVPCSPLMPYHAPIQFLEEHSRVALSVLRNSPKAGAGRNGDKDGKEHLGC